MNLLYEFSFDDEFREFLSTVQMDALGFCINIRPMMSFLRRSCSQKHLPNTQGDSSLRYAITKMRDQFTSPFQMKKITCKQTIKIIIIFNYFIIFLCLLYLDTFSYEKVDYLPPFILHQFFHLLGHSRFGRIKRQIKI